jgi:hypothetical protein
MHFILRLKLARPRVSITPFSTSIEYSDGASAGFKLFARFDAVPSLPSSVADWAGKGIRNRR